MLPVLQVGPLAIPVPQFSLLLAFWIGLTLAEKLAPRRGISADTLYNLVFTGLIAGLFGARIGYTIQYPNAFMQSPLSFFSPNTAMLDVFSGLAIAAIAMGIFGQKAKLPYKETLDALTPLFAVLAIGITLANAASGKSYGAETNLPWGISLWGAKRHPIQFIELAAAILILGYVISRSKKIITPGKIFLVFAAQISGAKLFLETFHGDSATILNGIRSTQVLAWIALAISLAALDIIQRKNNQKELEYDG